ncbi:hypothetical protein RRG08_004819 [Elysia crispata]|uniref:Uncharacterized protein n=1 Tax=Elysia crispata TaxID=231223 RepID=A0AAE0Y6P2_9GAST|nr:hypothetical protein RRG08_004819 [Elysia crispata]
MRYMHYSTALASTRNEIHALQHSATNCRCLSSLLVELVVEARLCISLPGSPLDESWAASLPLVGSKPGPLERDRWRERREPGGFIWCQQQQTSVWQKSAASTAGGEQNPHLLVAGVAECGPGSSALLPQQQSVVECCNKPGTQGELALCFHSNSLLLSAVTSLGLKEN